MTTQRAVSVTFLVHDMQGPVICLLIMINDDKRNPFLFTDLSWVLRCFLGWLAEAQDHASARYIYTRLEPSPRQILFALAVFHLESLVASVLGQHFVCSLACFLVCWAIPLQMKKNMPFN